tara:strand:+ start:1535 stop:1708 length:174 start_codon:yes stop_codon:yes gene_type:complete
VTLLDAVVATAKHAYPFALPSRELSGRRGGESGREGKGDGYQGNQGSTVLADERGKY